MNQNEFYEDLLGLPILSVTQVEKEGKQIHIYCESKLLSAYCPCCLKPCEKVNQTYQRKLQDLSISGCKVYLHLTTRQFKCPDCPRTFYEKFSFVDSYERMTVRYANYIYHRCIGVDLTYISIQEDLAWAVVNRIFKKYSDQQLSQYDLLAGVRALGIDEIALKKGHKNFVCVLVNLETGEVLDILPDRSKDYLIAYFTKLGKDFCEGIEVFSSDMWEGYINTAKQLFSKATIVVDRFHFFAHLQKALDSCRKSLRRHFPDREELKKVKWLFLKNGANLDDEQKQQLNQLIQHPDYVQLKQAYQAKEKFRSILEQDITPKQADHQLTQWAIEVLEQNNPFLNKFIKTLTNWYDYILNYFNGKWSNGIVEGINNKIKMIKRRAFGFDDFDSFRRRVLVEFL